MSNRRKSLVPLFAVAFIVAVISTGVFYGLFVGKLKSASVEAHAAARLLVAAHALPSGAVLKKADLREAPWPQPPLPAGAVSDMAAAVGKTLVAPLKENELLTQAHLGSEDGGPMEGGSMGIPEGMRAVSVQVHDSAGVVAMLKPGHRVDIQVVATQAGQGQDPQLRTILENMRVLAIPSSGQGYRGANIITVLATPKEAAMLGLADSTAKIRIALRNPIDQKKENLGSVKLMAILKGSPSPGGDQPVATTASATHQIQFLARILAVTKAGLTRLADHLVEQAPPSALLHVAQFRPQAPLEQVIRELEGSQLLEIISATRLTSNGRRQVGLQASAEWNSSGVQDDAASCNLRVRLEPIVQRGGKLRLKISPEIIASAEHGVIKRKVETELALVDSQSFCVRGWVEPQQSPALWQKLFPGRQVEADRELIVLITPRLLGQTEAASSD